MRNDLKPQFLVAMGSESRAPIQLMVMRFANESMDDLYLSDRDIVVDGKLYEGLVENWGDLATVGAENAISSTMTTTVTVWDGGEPKLSNLFLAENPVNTFVDLYQTFEDLPPSDMAHIGQFVVQDPVSITEVSNLIDLELVTTNMRYFGQVGEYLTRDKWPDALDADVNKPIDLIIGSPGRVKCLVGRKPPYTSTDRSVVRNTVTIEVSDNLDDRNFPSSGDLLVNGEYIRYWGRTDYAFTDCVRGFYGTTAREHTTGSQIVLATYVDYIIGTHVAVVGEVRVGGKPALVNPTFIPDVNGSAVLRFNIQPTYETFAAAISNGLYFDTTVTTGTNANTALNAHYAYDSNFRSKGALLEYVTGNHRLLNIANSIDNINEQGVGEIVNVFLRVTHWATKVYESDVVHVYVGFAGSTNLTSVGPLTKPNPAGVLELDADVLIDHPHTHATDGSHTHTVGTQPDFDNSAPFSHDHITQGAGTARAFEQVDQSYEETRYTAGYIDHSFYSQFPTTVVDGTGSYENMLSQVKVRASTTSYGYLTYLRVQFQFWNGSGWSTHKEWIKSFSGNSTKFYEEIVYLSATDRITSSTSGLTWRLYTYCKAYNTSTTGARANFDIYDVKQSYTSLAKNVLTTNDNTSVVKTMNTLVTTVNAGVSASEKRPSDVFDLEATSPDATKQVSVNQDGTSLYTQEYTDVFDLIDFKPGLTWDDLKNIDLTCFFEGTVDNAGVYVTWCDIEVEYRQPDYKITDDVSCIATSDLNNRPDAIIQFLLSQAGVPSSMFGSVYRSIPTWDDTDTWDDNAVWQDEGQVADVPTNALFEEAAAWFAHRPHYLINGVINGDSTIKEAIAKITWQTRSKLIWQHGQVQLVIARQSDDWTSAKTVDPDNTQMMSCEFKKSNVVDIVNKIDLVYNINRLSDTIGSGKYDSTVSVVDDTSVNKHGIREQSSLWLFDLVRNTQMATDLADYYLWKLGESSTYYTFRSYLTNYDLEKEDYITLDSNFATYGKNRAVVREALRTFGSGKLGRINTLKFIIEVIRKKNLSTFANDFIRLNDSLLVDFGTSPWIQDMVSVADDLLIYQGQLFTDLVTIDDFITNVMEFNTSFNTICTLGDTDISSEMSVVLDDSTILDDDFNASNVVGFGGPYFGTMPFGSVVGGDSFETDYANTLDELTTLLMTNFEDTVAVTDDLLAYSGFGSPLGDGFGTVPLGG